MVRDVRLITDNKTRRSKGISYVEFDDTDSVPSALGLAGQKLLGVPIIVQPSQPEKNRMANAANNLQKGNSGPMRLYVGSLNFNITEDMLRAIFELFGKVEDIKLIRDHKTSRSQGYGFITFGDAEEAKKALEQLNGFEVAGRPMKVNHVTERTAESPGNSLLDSDEIDRAGIYLGATGSLGPERRRSPPKRRSRERDHRRKSRSKSPIYRFGKPQRDRRYNRSKSKSSIRKEPLPELTPEERDARTVFCMQLSNRVRRRDLEKFFSSVGKVRDVRLITDNKTRRSKGISYVEFDDTDSVPSALGLAGQKLLGVPIIVQPSQPEKNRMANAANNLQKGNSGPMRLYVGSLNFNITEDMLRAIFEPFGKVEDIKLIRDHETSRSQGYGFITFGDAEEAKKALEQLNGFEVAGRPMKVNHVTERTAESPGNSLLDSDEIDRAGIYLGATGRLQLMAKLAEGTGFQIPQYAASALSMNKSGGQSGTPELVPPAPVAPPAQPTQPVQNSTATPIATQCFMFSNMFDPTSSATSVNSGSNHMSVGHSQLSALSQTSGITVALENPAQETPREPTPPPAKVLAENEFKLCKNCGALSKQIRMCESCGKTITMRDKTVTSYETVKPNILSGSKPKCQPQPPVHPNILTKRSFYGQKLQEQSQAYGGSLLTRGKDCGGGVQINSRRGKTAKQLSGAKVVPETVAKSSDEEDSVTDSGNQLNNSRAIMNSSDSASASGIMTNNSSVSANNENDSQHQNNTQTTSSEPDQSETSAMTDDLDSTNSEFGNISVFNVKRKVGMQRDRMEDSSGNVPAKRRKTTKKKQVQEESVEFLLKEPSVTLNVHCVRIGTLKGVPVEPVFLSKEGFFVKMECSESCCEIKIALKDLENIAYHLQKRLSVIYMNVSTTCGLRLRKELKTCSTQDEFFDPDTSELPRKFIIFFLESQLEKEEFNTLMTLFHHFEPLKPHREEFLQALISYEEAQIVLRQISNTSAATINSPSPTESPQSKSFLPEDPVLVLEESTAEMCPGTVGKLFTYQPASDRGAISITTEDLLCLRDGEFLNDVIIDFYLKYLMNEVFSEENKQRTYVFSSFFYTRLTQKQTRLSVKEKSQVDLKVRRHDMVKTWTRRVDLFAKDFIIVPINEHSHWFLAIICFPGLVKNKFLITTNTSSPPAHNSSSSENPESSMETEVNGDSVEKSTGASDINKLPCILVFDSLSGPARTSIVKTLREYLCVEWSAKKQTNRTFDCDTMRGGYPKVPQQNNFSDCGVYVLQFVETFFKKPIRDFSIPIKGLQDWFSEEEVSQKRGQLIDLILSLQQKNKLQSKPS